MKNWRRNKEEDRHDSTEKILQICKHCDSYAHFQNWASSRFPPSRSGGKLGKIITNNLLNCYITKPKTFRILMRCSNRYVASYLFLFILFSVATMFITCAGSQRTPFLFLVNHKGSTFSHSPCPTAKWSELVDGCTENLRKKKIPLSIRKLAREYFQNQR